MKTEYKAEVYRYMIEGLRDVVFLLDEHGRFVYINDRVKPLLGYQKQELLGEHFTRLLHPDDQKKSEKAYAQCINNSGRGAKRGMQLRVRHKYGGDQYRYFDIKLAPVPAEISQAYLESSDKTESASQRVAIYGAARDISQLKSLERIVQTNTNYDYLTGLPNRALLQDRVKYAIARARREGLSLAVMFIDLDGFKQVNDVYGHSAGDILLQAVSQRMVVCVRETDTLARVGGDEFVLLLPMAHNPAEVRRIAQKLIGEINSPFMINGADVPLSASIGIAIFPDNGESFDTLVNAADNAMYYIKHKQKNGFAFLADLPDRDWRQNPVYSP